MSSAGYSQAESFLGTYSAQDQYLVRDLLREESTGSNHLPSHRNSHPIDIRASLSPQNLQRIERIASDYKRILRGSNTT